ncbi:transposase, partial [Enterococcus sp. LJL51]|uniref:transposase n=1 Tax=Enterococcus sp. LJL51 TaxID=3416656 RepID=UPI003CF21944
ECKKKLSDEKTGSIYRQRKIDVEPVFGHLKAHLAFHRFHLRGKQGAKIDVGLALMALNLRKLGKYMERKRREEEKTSPILTFIIKIELVFFLRVDYVPVSVFYFINQHVQISCLHFLNDNCSQRHHPALLYSVLK